MNEVTETVKGTGSGTCLPEISEEYSRAVRLHGAIIADAQAAAYHLISLGKNLKEMNDGKLYKQLGYESLGDYASESVGLKGRAAYNYISAYETYGESGLQKYGALGITKLTELIRLPPDERAELLENGETAEMSTRELQAKIDELKKKNKQLTFELDEMMSDMGESSDKAEDEKAEMEKEIERLKAALEEEQKTKVLPAPEMSEAEKEEMRKTIEAETEARHAEEIKQAVEAERRAAEEERKKAKAAEKESTEKEKKAKAALSAAEEKQKELAEKLAAAEKENAVLQANAKKPLPSEAKERVKVHAKIVLDNFEAAAQVVRTADEAEREKLKEGLVKMAGQIGKIAESL